jgi:hypothetical protein
VCCSTDDGNSYTTNILCDEASGSEVPLMQCPTVCCDQAEAGFSVIPPADCAGNGDAAHPGHCEDVCCDIEGQDPVILLQGNCNLQNGEEVAMDECALQDEICCRYNDGGFGLATECVDGDPTDEANCEEVCCDLLGNAAPSTMLAGECSLANGVVTTDEDCELAIEKVCCKTQDGIAWVPTADCAEEDLLDEQACEQTYCCKVSDGPNTGNGYVVTTTECEELGGAIIYDGYCDQTVCCNTDDGPQMMPFSDCTFAQLTVTSDCIDEPQGRCCKIMDGPDAGNALWADASDCAQQGGAFVPEEYCEQVLCCNTGDGPQLLPYFQCTFLQLTVTSDCDPIQEDVCCKVMSGDGLGDAFMASPEDCVSQNGAVIFQEYCDQEICCDTGDGPQLMSYMECTFFQLITTDQCTPAEEDECCKISFGVDTGNVLMATASDCAELGGITTVQEYCDQTVCCSTDEGPQLVPFLECPFLSFAAFNPAGAESCDPPETPECCKLFLGAETGNVLLATESDCVALNGITTEMSYCEQIVCCDDGTGPVLVPHLECAFLDVLGVGECPGVEPLQCCKISEGPDTGNVVMATETDCAELLGIITEQDYCDQLMCCNTSTGPQWVPFLDCAFSDLNLDNECEPQPEVEVVCCSDGEGNFFEAEEPACTDDGGTPVSEVFCEPPPDEMICCALEDNNSYIWASECTNLGGSETAPAECVVCCSYPGGGTGQDPAVFCLAGGGSIVPDDQCEEPDELVCCITGDDAAYIEQSACDEESGTVTEITTCQTCCKNPFGNGPEYAFPEDCDQEQPESVCGGGGM